MLHCTTITYRPSPVSDEEEYVNPVDSISTKGGNYSKKPTRQSAVSDSYYNSCQSAVSDSSYYNCRQDSG